MATRRILTGFRPTGPAHLGHWVGALKQWVPLQDEGYDCHFLVADVQALTTHADNPGLIEWAVRELTLDWIAVGLDPTRPNVHFVLQSGVPELYELSELLAMIASVNEILRNPTIKSEVTQITGVQLSPDEEIGAEELRAAGGKITVGFFRYPVSQVADIELFAPQPPKEGDELLVPVGADQVPHLEYTNVLARRFNRMYGRVFLPCTPKVGEVGRLVGTDGNAKMSKSLDNAIYLGDDAKVVEAKVRGMFTDKTKIRKDDPGHPDTCPVSIYHNAFGDGEAAKRIHEECAGGRRGCVACKKELAAALNGFLDPIRARRKEAERMPIAKYLREGTERAREVGAVTMRAVREAMHLDYKTIFG